MDTGQAGPRGACVARHVVTAPGLKPGLVLIRLRPRVAKYVREVVWIPGFVICVNAQVCLTKSLKDPPIWTVGNRWAGCLCLKAMAFYLLTDCLLVNRSEGLNLSNKSGSSQTIHTYTPGHIRRLFVCFEA